MELDLNEIKTLLDEMDLPYIDRPAPEPEQNLMSAFGYRPYPLTVDLSGLDTLDADRGTLVQKKDLSQDNGVYVFAILESGRAGFLVVRPSTISRAPFVHRVTGDLVAAVTGVDAPPLLPFDMVEITGQVLVKTCLKDIMDVYGVEEAYRPLFLKLYLPKFLVNVAMYMTGAAGEDGSPLIYEETVNIEPAAIWETIKKEVKKRNEEGNTETPEKEEETPAG